MEQYYSNSSILKRDKRKYRNKPVYVHFVVVIKKIAD